MKNKKDRIKSILAIGKEREESIQIRRGSSLYVQKKYTASEMIEIMVDVYESSKEIVKAYENMRNDFKIKTFEGFKSSFYFSSQAMQRKELILMFSAMQRYGTAQKIAEIKKINKQDPEAAKAKAKEYDLNYEIVSELFNKKKRK